jgi:hypothetical protein
MSRRVDGALVLTADPINTAKGGRLIGDRTRRISLVMKMPGSRQSPTPVPRIWSRSDDGADTANDGGANAADTFSPASRGSVHILTSASRAELACNVHIPGSPENACAQH